jgi:hypothetical protein
VPADIAAAGYYCSNPYNVWRGNVASGGWSGFIFPGMPGPTGLSRNVTGIVPQNRPLLVFDGNSAHSSGYWWGQAGCIYTGGSLFYPNASRVDPTYNPGRVSGRSGYMNFTNTKVFLCSVGFMHWGSSLDIYGLEAHDIMRAGTVFGTVGIDNMLVDCRTQNMPSAPGTKSFERAFYNNGYTAFQFYVRGRPAGRRVGARDNAACVFQGVRASARFTTSFLTFPRSPPLFSPHNPSRPRRTWASRTSSTT